MTCRQPVRSRILAWLGPWTLEDRQLLRGWCLSGAGPAQYGWYLRSVAGECRWLGRDEQEVLQRLSEQRRLRALEVTQ